MKIKEKMNKQSMQNIIVILLIILMCLIIFFFQTKKKGFHEDEVFSIISSVNPDDGLMYAYDAADFETNEPPVWKSKEYVQDYVTLSKDNYSRLTSVYINQAKDNHPPIFYMLVHFSTILFGGKFSIYSVFVVNIIAFILSCLVIKKILKIIDKENITIPTLILYGLCIGTISMVIYQRMYMLLTLFVLLYFYYTIKIYKNDFKLDRLDILKLGLITVGGFLTQYFFVIYAFGMFIVMAVKMFKEEKKDELKRYILAHIAYAVIGIVLFPPCIYHLLFTQRGVKNLGNGNYFANFANYIKHLNYMFTIQTSVVILLIFLIILFLRITKLHDKKTEGFIVKIASISTLIYFAVTVKMTSFQELRYIMPIIPIIVITLYITVDTMIDIKYKNLIFTTLSVILTIGGLVFSKPKFLYENYEDILEIAEENKEKSFVYIYDNCFNHMQSIPEMLIYNKTLIINSNKNDELKYVLNNEELNSEDSYILSIKSYMKNEEILERIKNESDFKNITVLYLSGNDKTDEEVTDNLYLVSK